MTLHKIAVLNYGCGNVKSIYNMVKHVGGNPFIANKTKDLEKTKLIIIPGVGSFDNGMDKLNTNNFSEILKERVLDKSVIVIGICLGMQLMFETSEEGKKRGLGWFNGSVKSIQNLISSKTLKVPHMGWNNINIKKNKKIFDKLDNQSRFYFTHSYYCHCEDKNDIIAETAYGKNFTSAINKENIYGFQFHPEKSHKFGKILFYNLINNLSHNA